MNIIDVNKENLEQEHICCAISSNKDIQVKSKKAWLAEQFDQGLVFKKGDVRGKCFIEYLPAEKAWVPIEADHYMYIDCFWVSGQFKGKGYSNQLLKACLEDCKSKGKKGVVILSSQDKKKPFLCDYDYLAYKGFKVVDHVDPYFDLMCYTFEEEKILPKFKLGKNDVEKGFVLYYTHQCPFTAKYGPIIEQYAKEESIPFKMIPLTTREAAQKAPTPFTTYSLFYNNTFITNEILNINKFKKIIEELL